MLQILLDEKSAASLRFLLPSFVMALTKKQLDTEF
jgi:hypothetical protein